MISLEHSKYVPLKNDGDCFFSSLNLVNYFKTFGYGYTGTIIATQIQNYSITKVKTMEQNSRRTYDFCTDTEKCLTIFTWNDNRVILIVSSCNTGYASHWVSSEKKNTYVSQPFGISTNNKYIGGVDRIDKNIDKYRIATQ